jgi:Mn2+/Fe2+ NRAMP family transporter
LSKEYLINIVAILGTTISPYMFFWQAGEEVEEEVKKGKTDKIGGKKPKIKKKDIHLMRLDTIVGMLFSNLVMWFIIVTTASTLHLHHITDIQTADQAALALKPLAGDFTFVLFALGIIGTGLLAVPILAGSAAYALSETFGWKEGLYLKARRAPAFYGVIIIATLVGLLVNLTHIKPFQMLYYSAVLNGICAPPIMILIMLIGKNKKIMGVHTNSNFSNIMGWLITGIMTIGALGLLFSLFY